MKKLSLICLGALASSLMVTPAMAQSVSPTNTNFTATGQASLNKAGLPTQNCTLTLTGNSGNGTSGTITGGTNTGLGLCPFITVDPSTFTIDSTVNPTTVSGTVARIRVLVSGIEVCNETNRPFTADTSGNINFNSTIAPNCSVVASLNTPDIVAVP
ncbi:hypothetical protein [Parasphingorhabdus cellanae]|uniref:Protein activator of alkane oxidation PraB n=1 Tax=Parasphingorhabdus cellanae TaxID=2806553 RepID=A0ABX7T7A2_9SPHN|nr:hypothetical protein [Parasphingorhabdus cellanae]QTD57484.1 hypothetical protein J4G78_08155 [Parasphingorhabdus cellanae]